MTAHSLCNDDALRLDLPKDNAYNEWRTLHTYISNV